MAAGLPAVPVEIKALIDTVLDGFNSKNAVQYRSAFGGEVVIIDGMAPYRWTGPDAQGHWFADADRWAHELGVTKEAITYDSIVQSQVDSTHAYVVLSATLSFALKGERASRRGMLTFTLGKHAEKWRIESQAWARLS